MKTALQFLCLWATTLASTFTHAAEIPDGIAETFRNYLKNSAHVVLVCEVQKTRKDAPNPGEKHGVHVIATVVRTVKGKGVIGDRLHYYRLFEDKIPDRALELGNLTFLMLEDYGPDEFHLGTGDGWSYTSELDALLARILNEPKIPDTFLPAPGKLREVLQTPVSGTFRAAPPVEVVAALCRQLPANHVYKRKPGKAPAPNFTGTFKDTPLRTALYQVAQATHITVELTDRSDGTKLLSFRE